MYVCHVVFAIVCMVCCICYVYVCMLFSTLARKNGCSRLLESKLSNQTSCEGLAATEETIKQVSSWLIESYARSQ